MLYPLSYGRVMKWNGQFIKGVRSFVVASLPRGGWAVVALCATVVQRIPAGTPNRFMLSCRPVFSS